MSGLTEWNKVVKTTFKAGRKTNKNYSLKSAMLDAKKIYKKGTNVAMSIVPVTGRKNKTGRRTRRR
jgi:hypothetical protein